MTTTRKKWRIAIVLLFIVPFVCFEINVMLRNKREEHMFSKIKQGMTTAEVTSLIGKPYTVYCSNKSCDWQYFTETSYKSTNPFISFDSNGRVSYIYEFK